MRSEDLVRSCRTLIIFTQQPKCDAWQSLHLWNVCESSYLSRRTRGWGRERHYSRWCDEAFIVEWKISSKNTARYFPLLFSVPLLWQRILFLLVLLFSHIFFVTCAVFSLNAVNIIFSATCVLCLQGLTGNAGKIKWLHQRLIVTKIVSFLIW